MMDTVNQDISLFFAGSGDGRNVFSAITSLALTDSASRGSSFGKLHFTVLDVKPAAMARLLIFFNMMFQAESEVSRGLPNAMDYFLAMAYTFSCQIIPPKVESILQSNINELIKRLEIESDVLQFIYVREQDRKPLIRVLRQWQKPWNGMSKVADVRKFIEQERALDDLHGPPAFANSPSSGTRWDRNDFERLTTLMPPATVANRWEPSLIDALSEYRSTGRSTKLGQHVDLNWKINNTLIDYDFANRSREQGDHRSHPLVFHPLKVIESMDVLKSARKANVSPIKHFADIFRIFSTSTSRLGSQNRLVVEVIVGEMADIMERIRYNILDHRLSGPTDSGILDPTFFPRTFDFLHMSNIP